ncbi:HAD family hydrolase [Pseudoflavonifractor sp. MSJ-37]|uniref:HAD family hydrolase n=1 Tax=Pseudoflavonifractor sp. MSJ-37 TaxID=2841531 RepID=UPI0021113CE8|nr:HAD family hydrolase [Pseudoflavonifractor sp. MSJ-37]
MIRLIATDMDGTLLAQDHVTVPPRNLAALQVASGKGVAVAVASGRPWCYVRDLVEQMGCVDYAVLCNGASVLDIRGREWLAAGGLEEPLWRKVIGLLRARKILFLAYCGGEAYLERPMDEVVQTHPFLTPEFQRLVEETTQVVDDLDAALAGHRVEKIDCFLIPPDTLEELRRTFGEMGGLYLASGLRDNLEISSASSDKGRALAALCAQRRISREEVMAFGDGGNDVEMLRWAKWSFAMENGMEEAKTAAQYIAPPACEAGLGQMIERYALQDLE